MLNMHLMAFGFSLRFSCSLLYLILCCVDSSCHIILKGISFIASFHNVFPYLLVLLYEKRYQISFLEFSQFSCSFYVGTFFVTAKTCVLDSDCGGPPHNIRAWIKYVASCIQVRYVVNGTKAFIGFCFVGNCGTLAFVWLLSVLES